MDFSKTTQYAIRALSFMAQNEKELYIASELHEKLKIPQQYLRRMLKDLSKSGLLKSIKGKNGGFVFARSTEEIFLSDIVAITEKGEIMRSCIFGFESCMLKEKCAMHDIWAASKENVTNILSQTSLAKMNANFI
jgi:Rrf2 family protein